MAVLTGNAAMLIEHHVHHPFRGRLPQLGRQEMMFSVETLLGLLKKYDCRPRNEAELARVPDPRRGATDREFFGVFGFDAIDALDVSDFSGANVIFDMNSEAAPAGVAPYDCIYDGGTMEHVFHLPSFLRNVHRLLAEGGRVVHVNPASNSVEHGFYSFSPCFYYDYYSANRFRLEAAKLLDLGTRLRGVRITAYNCLPPIDRALIDGYLRGNIHYVFFVAEKTPDSTHGVVPQQGFYESMWKPETSGGGTPAAQTGPLDRIKNAIKARPSLERIVRKYATPFIRIRHIMQCRKMLASIAQRYY